MNHVVFVAGGTGGHINSAIALGERFKKDGFSVEYISGDRDLDFKLYQGKNCRHVWACPLVGKGLLVILKSLFLNGLVLLTTLLRFFLKRPQFVFGTGGYVCGPTLLAACLLGIPVFILEQNSVMGLTNRLLSKISKIIFTNFDLVQGLKYAEKARNYGNPLRKEFFSLKPIKKTDSFHILVFGGSLGSQEVNDLILDFLQYNKLDIKISILHQTGKNKIVSAIIGKNIDYQQSEYLDNIANDYQRANLVICRGGASTISELRVVRCPSVIIPMRMHKDQHQVYNAQALKEEADFPVYIESAEELSLNKCKKLQKLIYSEYKNYRNDISKRPISITDPSEVITKAVRENV